MSLNDAVDIIEQMQKLGKKAKKEDVKAEIKKCWGKLEDLAREEQARIEGAEAAFVPGKQRKVKIHKADQYRIVITSHTKKGPLDVMQEALVAMQVGASKGIKYEIVKVGEVV